MHTIQYTAFAVAYIIMMVFTGYIVKDDSKESDEEKVLRLTFATFWPILFLMFGVFITGETIHIVYKLGRKITGRYTFHMNSFIQGNLREKLKKTEQDVDQDKN